MRHQFLVGFLFVTASSWGAIASGALVTDQGLGTTFGGIEATQTLDTYVSSYTTGTFGGGVVSTLTTSSGTFTNDGLDTTHALGYLKDSSLGKNYGIALGDNSDASAKRGTLAYTLSGKVLNNAAGDDIFVSEQGSAYAAEAYMVRVSTNGGTTFSSWVYKHAQLQYGTSAGYDFFTGFDFISDFGLASTATVNLVEVQNCIATDKVASSTGEGTVVFSGDAAYSSAYVLTPGSYGTASVDSTTGGYATSKYDADPTYIFYASATAVPEPGTAMMLGAAALAALAWSFKRRK